MFQKSKSCLYEQIDRGVFRENLWTFSNNIHKECTKSLGKKKSKVKYINIKQ